jgi:hypothetical protein
LCVKAWFEVSIFNVHSKKLKHRAFYSQFKKCVLYNQLFLLSTRGQSLWMGDYENKDKIGKDWARLSNVMDHVGGRSTRE